MHRSIRLLLVESDPDGKLRRRLAETSDGRIEVRSASDPSDAVERLSLGGIDVVLLDLSVSRAHGIATFEYLAASAPDVPIIVLSDVYDEELGVSTLQAGAQDYLCKEGLEPTLLFRSVRYALERHRLLTALRSLSLMDDLTNLFNRRGFMDLGGQYLELARRSDREITLVYLDLDRFKDINDTYGHQVGDRALRRVADILRATFRRSDIVARMGGDEFAVLALEGSDEDPVRIFRRMRERFQEYNYAHPGSYQLEVSIGVARDAHRGVGLEELLAEADASMYAEKRAKLATRRA